MNTMKRLLIFATVFTLIAGSAWLCAQEWELRATLRTDSCAQETVLWLDRHAELVLDRAVVIESRDGKIRAIYDVEDLVGDMLVLKEPLKEKYSAGSRIFQ